MGCPVVHFEIYGDNPEKLGAFYRDVFGWQVMRAPGMEYWMLGTVPVDEQFRPKEPGGINGGLMKRPMPDARCWMSYVQVDQLEAAAKQIEAKGGKVLKARTPIPGMGAFMVVADPEGNPFGIWELGQPPK